MVWGRVTAASALTCGDQALHRDPFGMGLVRDTGRVGVEEAGWGRAMLPALAGGCGPSWGPGTSMEARSPRRALCLSVQKQICVFTLKQKILEKVPLCTSWQGPERTRRLGAGGCVGQQLGAAGMEGHKGGKGLPTKAVRTNTLRSNEGTAGCVGQSPQCCVLGKETSGHRVSGWRAPGGAGFLVCHVPGVEGMLEPRRVWVADEHPAFEVPGIQGPQAGVVQDARESP